MPDAQDLESYLLRRFSEHVGLPEAELLSEDMTLAALITRSDRMTNSVDLMEAFARTSNALRKDYGLRVRLPALSLDTPVSKVLAIFLDEVRNPERKSA
ncbi:MAG: hypothetical protein EOO71_16725 [Myxococcaceae bacterium]|nr:MAG: hypothetical protein EOO71_16725 [Myxococcaceae bacterium]